MKRYISFRHRDWSIRDHRIQETKFYPSRKVGTGQRRRNSGPFRGPETNV